MNRAEIVEKISKKTHIAEADINKVLDSFEGLMGEHLKDAKSSFETFKAKMDCFFNKH